jgi:hypothetical protein
MAEMRFLHNPESNVPVSVQIDESTPFEVALTGVPNSKECFANGHRCTSTPAASMLPRGTGFWMNSLAFFSNNRLNEPRALKP